MVKLVFVRRSSVGSFAIRAFTASRWSHVALLTGEGTVIDATARHGVAERSWDDFIKGASAFEFADVAADAARHTAVVEAARPQIGKKYDFLALLGIWFRSGWEEESKWFCSELVAWSLNTGLRPIFRTRDVRGVWPQHIWMLLPLLTGTD